MKISTKGRYGLRSMADLAVNSKGEPVSLNSIAERQKVSVNYLEQVFSSLRKGGLVKSVKGAQGGYILSDSASNITVGDVLRVLEGNLFEAGDEAGKNNPDNSIEYCINTNVWDKIDKCINDIVDSITLEELAAEYRKLSGNLSTMYYI